jgi:hypothetical protein
MRTKNEKQAKRVEGPSQREVLRDVMLSAAQCGSWLTLRELSRLTNYGETVFRRNCGTCEKRGTAHSSSTSRCARVAMPDVRRRTAQCGNTVCAVCGVPRRDAIGSARRCYLHRHRPRQGE